MRLIDANSLRNDVNLTDEEIDQYARENVLLQKQWRLLAKYLKAARDGFVMDIDETPTVDPESLPIVQELRKKLARYEKEVEILKSSAGINCLSCEYMHKNGNCTAVGGFCTAVPAAYCKLIPELREKLARYEQAHSIAMEQLRGKCFACAHAKEVGIGCKTLHTCEYMKQRGVVCCSGNDTCEHWEWNGGQSK